MINAHKLACLQALDITIWQPKSEVHPIRYYQILNQVDNPELLVVMNIGFGSDQTSVLQLLSNILFSLKLSLSQCAIALILDQPCQTAISFEDLQQLQAKRILGFGAGSLDDFENLSLPKILSLDLSQVINSPLLKRQVMIDVSALSI